MKIARKRPTVTTTMTLPTSDEQKARYRRLQNEVDTRNLSFVLDGHETSSIHDLTRQEIDRILDRVEQMLASA